MPNARVCMSGLDIEERHGCDVASEVCGEQRVSGHGPVVPAEKDGDKAGEDDDGLHTPIGDACSSSDDGGAAVVMGRPGRGRGRGNGRGIKRKADAKQPGRKKAIAKAKGQARAEE